MPSSSAVYSLCHRQVVLGVCSGAQQTNEEALLLSAYNAFFLEDFCFQQRVAEM